MKAKRGATIRWPGSDAVERIPPERTFIAIWKDRFGTVHATGWGPDVDTDSDVFDEAVRKVLVKLRLNAIIEP